METLAMAGMFSPAPFCTIMPAKLKPLLIGRTLTRAIRQPSWSKYLMFVARDWSTSANTAPNPTVFAFTSEPGIRNAVVTLLRFSGVKRRSKLNLLNCRDAERGRIELNRLSVGSSDAVGLETRNSRPLVVKTAPRGTTVLKKLPGISNGTMGASQLIFRYQVQEIYKWQLVSRKFCIFTQHHRYPQPVERNLPIADRFRWVPVHSRYSPRRARP